jgi:sensor c-di-GMP phosphodiesterase-like protein
LIEARLRSIGKYKGQGWLFGRPMPIPEVRKLLADRSLLPVTRDQPQTTQRSARSA